MEQTDDNLNKVEESYAWRNQTDRPDVTIPELPLDHVSARGQKDGFRGTSGDGRRPWRHQAYRETRSSPALMMISRNQGAVSLL